MVIPNCESCQYELRDAYRYQQAFGYYLATGIFEGRKMSCYPNVRKHFALILVNNKGKVVAW